MHGRKVAEAGTIYFATIGYWMDGPLTEKDCIKFSEDYNLYVLQTTQSFFLPRFETRVGNRSQYHICIFYNVK
jgi:hypothetical protein